MYNKNYQVNYTTNYIYLIKSDKYFYSNSINQSAINCHKLEDFLFNDSTLKHHYKSVQYILFTTLDQYFCKQL